MGKVHFAAVSAWVAISGWSRRQRDESTDEADGEDIAIIELNYLFFDFPRGRVVEGAFWGLLRPPLLCAMLLHFSPQSRRKAPWRG